MTRAELLERVRSTWEDWSTLIAGVVDGRMETVVEEDGRTLKDIVAHVSWFEKELVELLRTRRLEGSELWKLSRADRNDAITEMNSERAAEDVLRDATATHAELERQLATLEDEDLNDPSRFENMPQDWIPWRIIAENTFEHYEAHAEDVRRRLGHEEA